MRPTAAAFGLGRLERMRYLMMGFYWASSKQLKLRTNVQFMFHFF
jgi:hypothetical protein